MDNLTEAMLDGFSGRETTAIYSSPIWQCWLAGKVIKQQGYINPKLARMSKGYNVNVYAMGWKEKPVKVLISTETEHGASVRSIDYYTEKKYTRDDARRDCGLVKVRGRLGGTYWE